MIERNAEKNLFGFLDQLCNVYIKSNISCRVASLCLYCEVTQLHILVINMCSMLFCKDLDNTLR